MNLKSISLLGLFVLSAFLVIYNRESQTDTDEFTIAQFTEWKSLNNKTYGASEEQKRYKVFRDNLRRIQKINSMRRNFTLKLNEFADLSRDEFISLHLGLKPIANTHKFPTQTIIACTGSVDWRNRTAVTPVKNQGQCGASWAFAAIGALEGFAAIQRGELPTFSEQQLIDCSAKYGNQGCNGGSMKSALQYTSENGVILEADYPYVGIDDLCKYDRSKVDCKNQRYLYAYGDIDLQKAVDQGPVAVSVEADQDVFRFYESGILDSVDCGTKINHGALAVGYGAINNQGYWIIKNSWGTNWGEKGYLKIARVSGAGICGINLDNVYPALGDW